METIKTVCHRDCPDTCFVDVIVEGGRIASTRGSMDNPITQGFLCARGMGDPRRVYSDNRALNPRLGHSPTSWDEALEATATRLRETLDRYGPESVLLYDYPGNQGFLAWQYPRRLWFALGATTTDYALCATAGYTGIEFHHGSGYGRQFEELIDHKLIIYWGNNGKVSSPHS